MAKSPVRLLSAQELAKGPLVLMDADGSYEAGKKCKLPVTPKASVADVAVNVTKSSSAGSGGRKIPQPPATKPSRPDLDKRLHDMLESEEVLFVAEVGGGDDPPDLRAERDATRPRESRPSEGHSVAAGGDRRESSSGVARPPSGARPSSPGGDGRRVSRDTGGDDRSRSPRHPPSQERRDSRRSPVRSQRNSSRADYEDRNLRNNFRPFRPTWGFRGGRGGRNFQQSSTADLTAAIVAALNATGVISSKR